MRIKNAGTGCKNQPSAFSSANNAAWREEQTARPYLGEKETAGNGNLKKLWLRSRREQPMPPAPSSFDGFDSVALPLLPFVPPNKPSDTCSCTSLRALLAFFKQVLPAFENGELPLRFQKQGRVPPPLSLPTQSSLSAFPKSTNRFILFPFTSTYFPGGKPQTIQPISQGHRPVLSKTYPAVQSSLAGR